MVTLLFQRSPNNFPGSLLATDNMSLLTSTEPEGPTDRAAAKATIPVPHCLRVNCERLKDGEHRLYE